MSSPANEAAARASTVASIGQTIPTDAEVGPPTVCAGAWWWTWDRCTGCQACVVPARPRTTSPSTRNSGFLSGGPRPGYGSSATGKANSRTRKRALSPVLCQHCGNAPCETVCPVWATYHNRQGLNVQVYNRCIGTRFCANGCPYSVRYFNFWNPEWPEPLNNPAQSRRDGAHKGIIEKCTFCVQRINRVQVTAKTEGREIGSGEVQPACAQSCPTSALVFCDLNDPNSRPARLAEAEADRSFTLLKNFGTDRESSTSRRSIRTPSSKRTPTPPSRRTHDSSGSRRPEAVAASALSAAGAQRLAQEHRHRAARSFGRAGRRDVRLQADNGLGRPRGLGVSDSRSNVHSFHRHGRAPDRLRLANGQGLLGAAPAPRRRAVCGAFAAQLRPADSHHGHAAAAGRPLQPLVRLQRRCPLPDRRVGARHPAAYRNGSAVVLGRAPIWPARRAAYAPWGAGSACCI